MSATMLHVYFIWAMWWYEEEWMLWSMLVGLLCMEMIGCCSFCNRYIKEVEFVLLFYLNKKFSLGWIVFMYLQRSSICLELPLNTTKVSTTYRLWILRAFRCISYCLKKYVFVSTLLRYISDKMLESGDPLASPSYCLQNVPSNLK